MPLGPAEIPDDFVTRAVAGLTPYEPGKPVEEVQRELGLEHVVKLASNEGPFPPFPAALEAMERAARGLNRYPDGGAYRLRARLAEKYDVAFEQVTVGSGADGVIDCVSQAFLEAGDEIVCGWPSFPSYVIDAVKLGAVPVRVPLANNTYDLDALLEAITPRTKVVYLCNPNNPTGTMNTRAQVDSYFERVPDHVLTVLDQAYQEYIDDPEYPDGIEEAFRRGHRALVVRTFSKIYGLAGLRVGYGVGPAPLIEAIHKVRRAFDVATPGQEAALASLAAPAELARRRAANRESMAALESVLREGGFDPLGPAVGNFLFVDVGTDAAALYDALLRRGVIVRPMGSFGAPTALRVTAGTAAEIAFLAEQLGDVFSNS